MAPRRYEFLPWRPDGAWCSHCDLVEPMPLVQAINHRELEHADCFSCQLEILLYHAIRAGHGRGGAGVLGKQPPFR